jgi:hypothetical protein
VLGNISQRLTGLRRGDGVSGRDLGDEVEQRRAVGRQILSTDGAGEDHLGVILAGEHCEHRRATRSRVHGQNQLVKHCAWNTHVQSGICHADVDLVKRWTTVSELFQEHWRS